MNVKNSNTGRARYYSSTSPFSLWAVLGTLLVGCTAQSGLLDEVTLSAFGIAPTDIVDEAAAAARPDLMTTGMP